MSESEPIQPAAAPAPPSTEKPAYDLEPPAPEAPRPVITPAAVATPAPAPLPTHSTDFIKPGLGSAQTIAIAGATILVIATIMAAVHAPTGGWWSHGLLTLYLGLLHAGTGAVAVGFVGYSLGREIGNIPLAAARMLFAVALVLLTISAGLPLNNFFLYTCALGLYVISTLILFRWEIAEWGGVASIHGILWFLMYLAAQLQVMVAAKSK